MRTVWQEIRSRRKTTEKVRKFFKNFIANSTFPRRASILQQPKSTVVCSCTFWAKAERRLSLDTHDGLASYDEYLSWKSTNDKARENREPNGIIVSPRTKITSIKPKAHLHPGVSPESTQPDPSSMWIRRFSLNIQSIDGHHKSAWRNYHKKKLIWKTRSQIFSESYCVLVLARINCIVAMCLSFYFLPFSPSPSANLESPFARQFQEVVKKCYLPRSLAQNVKNVHSEFAIDCMLLKRRGTTPEHLLKVALRPSGPLLAGRNDNCTLTSTLNVERSCGQHLRKTFQQKRKRRPIWFACEVHGSRPQGQVSSSAPFLLTFAFFKSKLQSEHKTVKSCWNHSMRQTYFLHV